MSANIDVFSPRRPSGIKRNAMDKRVAQIEKELEAIRDDLMQLTTMLFTILENDPNYDYMEDAGEYPTKH